ncbi:hypothetical protein [Amycolatopsis tucumanensis]|uniref:Uncharacterized protein n=1 Tax=Amycolatopsis tucumanensis TaxID=401106 RepID=A0ABP7HGJ5_9PSEU|nr:hypothetical protein [Amycolatopsis tucumanensis]MCF6423715.1 hypothetical protein [Amycolatopsis tucumanensis]
MSATHRPLSPWVAMITDRDARPVVNDGDDRADARTLPWFDTDWARVAVPLRDGRHALGLADARGTTVVELDDYGSPITVSPTALGILSRWEEHWPLVGATLEEDIAALSTESLPLRYWLLERLADEGDPPDEVFTILPWHLLNRAADSVTAALQPDGRLGELVEIRHWLTPAVRGLAGPLEQLDHGLRTGDGAIARLGAAALLSNLLTLPLERIPGSARTAVRRLVVALGRTEPVFRHTSRVVAARLTDAEATPLRGVVSSTLEAAAGTHDVRERSQSLGDDSRRLRLTETQAGRLRLSVRLRRDQSGVSPLAELTDAFLPVHLASRDRRDRRPYWIALQPEGGHWSGALNLSLPHGTSVVEADDVPVGPEELASLDPSDLTPSLHASTTPTANQWLDIADRLPEPHPVRIAARTFEDSL